MTSYDRDEIKAGFRTYPTTNIAVTNNVLWSELLHARTVGRVGVDGVVFQNDDIIKGRAFLIGHLYSFP